MYLENIYRFSKNKGIQEFYILPAHDLLDQKEVLNNKKAMELFDKVALNISKQYFLTENIKFSINKFLIKDLSKKLFTDYKEIC